MKRCYFFSAFMIAAGSLHFIRPEFYLKIMPPYLPYPRELIFISGAIEILAGISLLYKPTRTLSVWAIILLLIAVFPANIYMAMNPKILPDMPAWAGWARLPFQAVFIAWAYSCLDKK